MAKFNENFTNKISEIYGVEIEKLNYFETPEFIRRLLILHVFKQFKVMQNGKITDKTGKVYELKKINGIILLID